METTAVRGHVEAPQPQAHSSNAAAAVERTEQRQERREEEVRVAISEEARSRRAARDRESVAPPTTDAPSRSANSGPAPTLVVRFGLPEAPQVPSSEELLRQKLAERSGIRSVQLGGLVTTPKEQERAASGAQP